MGPVELRTICLIKLRGEEEREKEEEEEEEEEEERKEEAERESTSFLEHLWSEAIT